jgi:cystathionine beta-lyase/cystathionine gamma-synthase
MDRHSSNAMTIAEFCAQHPKIKATHYPGLISHPQHDIAKRQMSAFGGMISIELGSLERAVEVTNKLKLFTLAESLGGVESLVCHPVSMTHGSIPKEQRERLGVTDGLIRLSCGIEDVEDLMLDVEQALA